MLGNVMGGASEEKPADEDIQQLCQTVKPLAEARRTSPFEVFLAVSYKSQVVAGTNFFIKVHVGGEDHVHLRVFRDLPCNGGNVELHGILESKTKQDPLEYFEGKSASRLMVELQPCALPDIQFEQM